MSTPKKRKETPNSEAMPIPKMNPHMDITCLPAPEDVDSNTMETTAEIRSRDGRFQIVIAKWQKIDLGGVLDWRLVSLG